MRRMDDAATIANKNGDHCLLLHRACEAKDIQKVGRLLRHAVVDVNERDPMRRTPLVLAATQACAAIVFQLLDVDGVDLDARDTFGKTALHYAVENNSHVIVLHLVARHADPNASDRFGNTPLMTASVNGHALIVQRLLSDKRTRVDARNQTLITAVWYASANGHADVVRLLVDARANARAADCQRKSPLLIAAEKGHLDCVRTLLDYAIVNVDEPDKFGQTALQLAVQHQHTDIAVLLMEHGASARVKTEYDQATVFMTACQTGNTRLVAYLLERMDGDGGDDASHDDRHAVDFAMRTALYYACDHPAIFDLLVARGFYRDDVDRSGKSVLMRLAQVGSADGIRAVLARKDTPTFLDRFDYDGTTAMAYAAIGGHTDAVRALLAAGASCTVNDLDDHTPLMHAAYYDHADVVDVLVEAHAAFLDSRNYRGSTALATASMRGSIQSLARLLEAGASVTLGDKHGATPLMKACYYRNAEAVQLLLRYHNVADVNQGDEHQQTALYYACREDSLACAQLLLDHGADPAVANVHDVLPVMLPAIYGNVGMVRAILAASPEGLNHQDRHGQTALYFACEGNHTDIALALLDHGADPGLAAHNGTTPLILAATANNAVLVERLCVAGPGGGDNHGRTALFHASFEGYADIVRILLAHGADPFAASDAQTTPLLQASECGFVDIVQDLIAAAESTSPALARVLVNRPNEKRVTPLHAAARKGRADIVRLLLRHRADPTQRDDQGHTALMEACMRRHIHCAQQLLDHDSTVVNWTTRLGRTALFYAISSQRPDVVQLLHRHGADIGILFRNRTIWATGYPQHLALPMIHTVVDTFGVDVDAVSPQGRTAVFLLAHAFGNKTDAIQFYLTRNANPWIRGPGHVLPIAGARTPHTKALLKQAMEEPKRVYFLQKARTLSAVQTELDRAAATAKTRHAKRLKCTPLAPTVLKERFEKCEKLPEMFARPSGEGECLEESVLRHVVTALNDDLFVELTEMMRQPWA